MVKPVSTSPMPRRRGTRITWNRRNPVATTRRGEEVKVLGQRSNDSDRLSARYKRGSLEQALHQRGHTKGKARYQSDHSMLHPGLTSKQLGFYLWCLLCLPDEVTNLHTPQRGRGRVIRDPGPKISKSERSRGAKFGGGYSVEGGNGIITDDHSCGFGSTDITCRL
jgi:hypothetical protein